MPRPPDDRQMTVAMSCALVSDAPLSTSNLEIARLHFAEMAKLLEASGPAFVPSHRLAMQLNGRAIARLHGVDPRRWTRQPVEDERLAVE
jgi:hypothetical protein